MSGSNVPYHLRPNKYVERQLFLEALQFVNIFNNLDNYVYVSMGGRFLEDFRLIHRHFGMKNLISFDKDKHICDRQEFNSPNKFVEILNKKSEEIVNNFESLGDQYNNKNFIIWLDYTTPNERQSQLHEIHTLSSKLCDGDVIKVTLNANVNTVKPNRRESEDLDEAEKNKITFENTQNELGVYMPNYDPASTVINAYNFSKILAHAIQKALLDGIASEIDLEYVPLTDFRYSDGHHQMLTVTAILLHTDKIDNFKNSTRFINWEFASQEWGDVKLISVPDLSIKERYMLDELIFSGSTNQIHSKLPFKFDEDYHYSLNVIKAYKKYYRHYPHFARVII